MSATPAEPRDVRASDAERDEVAKVIQQAAAEGRLTPDETDQRMAALYATRFRGELAGLTDDLPNPAEPPSLADRPWLGTPLVVHAVIVAIIAVLLVARWVVGPVPFFWPAWPILWLSISVLVHARIRRRGRPSWR